MSDFLSYLKPGAIHANVIPRVGETFASVEDRMKQLCFDVAEQPDEVKVSAAVLQVLNDTVKS